MRQLRLVRSADEGNQVIVETADGAEQFSLPVDAALRDAIRTDLPRVPSGTPAAEDDPAMTPREIQVRVRAGESPQELAEANQLTLERVLLFAAPVIDERHRIAGEARRARARRSTTDGQSVVFGEAVDERFAAHGIDPAEVRWDARRREDGAWIIQAAWRGGDSDRAAEWTLQLGTRTVTPLDDTAADLLSDRPIRPVATPVTGPVRSATAPPLAPGVVAFPVMPDAHTDRLPRAEEVFDQDALELGLAEPAGEPATGSEPAAAAARAAAPATERSARRANRADRAAAPQPPQIKNLGVAHRGEESDQERAERARIPSWDDILLGVRRKRD